VKITRSNTSSTGWVTDMVIEWRNTTDPLPESMIRGAEMVFGVSFPGDYRECLRVNHGGHPDPGDFTVRGPTLSWVSCIGVLLSLDWRRPCSVWEVLASLAIDRQVPDGLFPVADDGGGDLLCLDFRSRPSAPAVVYWSHEVGGDQGLVPVAESFSELLSRLGVSPDSRADAGPEVKA
jgi:hypothetical protein